MSQPIEQKCVMIIAGEASGDLHGSKVVRAMNDRHDDLAFYGIGGQALKNAGVKILVDAAELSVVGITEAVANARKLLGGISAAKGFLKTRRPDLLILIDFPDFNLRVARSAKKLDIPVLYYISPQIWAWRQGRVKKIKRLVDHMAVILPFEATFFEKADIPVTFVGHPLLDIAARPDEKMTESNRSNGPVIGLLPGSRHGEVRRHLPAMIDSARILTERIPNVEFIVSAAATIDRSFIESMLADQADGIDIAIETGDVQRIFDRSTLVVAASGTVTLEAAIVGVPMVVVYKVSPLSAWLGRRLIRVDYVCLVNLIADELIVPELLQEDASPETIAGKVGEILSDSTKLDRMHRDLLDLHDKLGGTGASKRVGDIALGMLKICP